MVEIDRAIFLQIEIVGMKHFALLASPQMFRPHRVIIRSIERETTVSTQTPAPAPRAWFPPQDALCGWAQRAQGAPRQGTRAFDCGRETRQSVSKAVTRRGKALTGAFVNLTRYVCVNASPLPFRVKRAWRLKAESDVQRVWQQGRAFAHPLVILRVRENGLERSRAAFVAGKKLGNAVTRNRAKRRLREAVRPQFLAMPKGYDFVFIARGNITTAPFTDIGAAIVQLLQRAKLSSKDSPEQK